MDGTPREVFSQVEKLKEYRLDVPQATELAYELKKAGSGSSGRNSFTGRVCGGVSGLLSRGTFDRETDGKCGWRQLRQPQQLQGYRKQGRADRSCRQIDSQRGTRHVSFN